MDELTKLLKKIQKLDRVAILKKVYDDAFKKFAIDLNRIDQLYVHGEDSQGKELIPPYSAITKFIKERKNQVTDHVTLKDTGDFYETFALKIFNNMDFEINADDQGKDLFEKYGTDIVGWTNENKDLIIKYVQDEFVNEIIRLLK